MGIWNLLGQRSAKVKKSVKGPRRLRGNAFRVPMLETLESRFVLTGPALQGIFTDGMIALHASNDPYHQAPNEFIIQFDANQQIDPSSLGGITFQYGATAVTPGYIGIGSKPNEVVARFDGMAEGTYTLQIAGTGSTALKNTAGEKFANGQANASSTFVVNTAAQIVSVVPQPVTRNAGGGLTQASNQIVVYFNQTMGNSVANLAAYQLFNTNGTLSAADDSFINPLNAVYNASDKSVTLTFSSIPEGNYRLRVGNAEVPVPVSTQLSVAGNDPTDTFAGADATPVTAVLGTSAGNLQSAVISGASIQNTQVYNSLVFPGAGNEPGARNISLGGPNSYDGTENSIRQVDNTPGITVQQFNFKSIYGNSPSGSALVNQITELQKQRVRQAMSLWSNYLGIEFVETADQGWTIAVGDTQAVDPNAPSSAYRGIADPARGLAVISSAQNWGASEFGGAFQKVALHELGILLGLERTTDTTDSIMSGDIEDPTRPISNTLLFSGDAPLPGYVDITNGQVAQRPESRDIDLYRVQLTEGGTLRLQTIAQRLNPQASLLNSVITVYDSAHNIVARNDDYYGSDSYLEVKGLAAGTYYIAVTSTGNTNFNPMIADSGMGGTTEGAYQLRMDFDPSVKPSQILDSTNLALDGDGDGQEGGEFNFWFQSGNTIFVDKASDTTPAVDGNGSAATPYDNIASALAAAASRIVVPANVSDIKAGDTFTLGNGISNPVTFFFTDSSITTLPIGAVGISIPTPANASQLASNIVTKINGAGLGITATLTGTVINLAAAANSSVRLDLSGSSALLHTPNLVRVAGNQLPSDNYAYLVGQGRPDGSSIVVPQGVTLMIDSGAVLKFDNAGIEVGNSLPNINRTGGALQVFGTPKSSVVFTSMYDDAVGGDAADTQRAAGVADWAGVVFRPGSDFEKDGIFRNFIAGATFAYGGGSISGNSQPTYSAIDITGSRPTIIGTTLRQNAGAAISADPQSFAESNYGVNTTMNVDYSRLGLSIYGVTLLNNGQNGLAIRSQAIPGSAGQEASGTIHLNDTGIVHIVTQDLLLAQGLNTVTDVTYKGTSPYVAPNYIVLDSLASSTNDYYVGQQVQITDSAGVVLQTRKIIAYDGLTKRATVDQVWGSTVLGIKPTQRFVISGRLASPGANLVIDGDTIVKLSNTRIDAQFGSQLLAEGTAQAPVIFTSILDDTYGAGGSFDTNGNGSAVKAAAGNWAGIYFAPTSTGSLDYARITYAGGTSSIQGTVDSFNPISIIQAQVRIAHSLIANNLGGQAATSRSGLGSNVSSTIFVRGAQPIIVGNTIRDSLGAAISIDASSLNNIVQGDSGRQTGAIAKVAGTDGNFGAVVVGNVLTNDQINGMNVRGGILTTESIWDDTDIVHVVLDQIFIPNQQVYGGLRLQSSAAASLIVKFQSNPVTGTAAGITATGTPLDIPDRIGGTLQIIGTPARSVILTTLADDTVGAGVDVFGKALTDTNNDGSKTPLPGSWAGVKIDQYANDRNVKAVVEQEAPTGSTTDSNATPTNAESLGTLAANINSGDENNRLGFVVDGSIAYNRSSDVDVYKFNAVAGTEVWFDIDRTWSALGAILELVDANGTVLARSVGNDDASNSTFGNSSSYVQSLDPNTQAFRMEKDTAIGPDTYSTNFINTGGNNNGVSRDPGMRVILPGQTGANQTYFIRVRSNPQPTATSTNVNGLTGGLSSGTYELQVRLRQADEAAGTTVRYADVRYATNGIAVSGQPTSPLTGTSGDVEGATGSGQNNTSATAQDLGNILKSDQSTISINGFLSANPTNPTSQTGQTPVQDVDWYKFNVNYDFVQAIQNANNAGQSFAAIFDLDYGAGVGRIDTTISVYMQTIDPATGQSVIQLVLVGRDSNVLDDQVNTSNVNGNASDALSRGSQSNGDPFIGSVQLPAGNGAISIPRTYFVAISSSGRNPTPLNQFYQHLGADNLTRLQPINSINVIAESHVDFSTPQLQNPSSTTANANPLYPPPSSPANPAQQYAAAHPLFGTPDPDMLTTDIDPVTLGANATPYTLADIQMWSLDSSGTLRILNPYTGQTDVFYDSGKEKLGDIVLHGLAMRPDGLIYAIADGTDNTTPASYVTINPSDGTVTRAGSVTVRGQTVVQSLTSMTFTGVDPGNANADGFNAVGVTSWGQYISMRARDGAANVDQLGLQSAINANRFAVKSTTSGTQVVDGDNFVVTPIAQGAQSTVFELNKPLGLIVVNVPTTQPVVGGVDPDIVLTIKVNTTDKKIELDTNGTTPTNGQLQVHVNGLNQAGLAAAIAAALNADTPGTAFSQGNTLFVLGGSVTGSVSQGALVITQVDPAYPSGAVTSNATAVSVVGKDTNGNLHFLQGKELADAVAKAINDKLGAQGVKATSHEDLNVPGQYDVDLPLSATLQVNGQTFSSPNGALAYQSVNFGNITGMAYVDANSSDLNFSYVYAVTSTGNVLTLNATTGELMAVQQFANTVFTGLTRMPKNVQGAAFKDYLMAATSTGRLIALQIVQPNTFDPKNVQLFQRTTAVNVNGDTIPVFAGQLSGVQNFSVAGGGGIIFTPIDYNIWHATTERAYDPGHGVNNAFDQSVTQNTLPGDQGLGGISYVFNLDALDAVRDGGDGAGQVSLAASQNFYNSVFRFRTDMLDSYNLPGGAWGSLTSNTFNLAGYSAQDMPTLYFNYYLQTEDALAFDLNNGYGSRSMADSLRVFISDDGVTWHQVATNDSTPSNYYDPTNYVPPQGRRQSELPEVYSAQGGQYVNQSNLSAAQNSQTRVQELFDDVTAISPEGGKSTPFVDPDTNGAFGNPKQWRQARIDLGDFAGMSNLRIRFDFSTAGDMQEPTKMRVTMPNVGGNTAAQNLALLDGGTFTLVNPVNNAVTTYELDTNGVLNDLSGTVKRVSIHLEGNQLTDAQLAAQIAAQVNTITNQNGLSFGAITMGLTGEVLGQFSDSGNFNSDPVVQGVGVDQNIIRFDVATSLQGARPVLDLGSSLQKYFSSAQTTGAVFGAQPARLGEIDLTSGQKENLQGDSFGNYNNLTRAQNNHFEGAYIDDLIIGFASRGEMVTRTQLGTTSDGKFQLIAQPTNQDVIVDAPENPNPFAAKPAASGSYHLEIRPGVSYGEALTAYDIGITNFSTTNGGPASRVFTGQTNLVLTNSFDINDRLTHAFDIVAMAGRTLVDGQSFSINDGAHTVTFEFDKSTTANPNGNGVTAGRVKVGFKASDEAWQVADSIALAIRSATGQGFRLDVDATTANLDRVAFDKVISVDQATGLVTYATPNPYSAVVNLIGATDATPRSNSLSSGITVVEYGADPQHNGQSTHDGDSNLQKQQGTIIIESSRVTDSAGVGIAVTSARDTNDNRTYPGVPTSFPTSTATTTAASAVPGVVLVNNIIAGFGTAGIAINGDSSITGPTAAVPFARVVNNTIYGSLLQTGIGIVVGDNASPTIINNIIANTATAIQTSSKASAVLVGELYSNNKANRTIQDATTQAIAAGDNGAQSLIQAPTDQIFVNPTTGNFYLRPGTKSSPNLAIDSAVDVLGDRADLAALRASLGMGASSILAPDKDINNQSRADDPTVSTPPGVGNNSLKDRGAVERADFIGPFASLLTPKDNGPTDTNLATNDVSISGVVSTKFEIKLQDLVGLGVDPTSIQGNDVVLTLGGQTLVQGSDYVFAFDASRNVIVLSTVGAQFRAGTYQVILNNTATGITDKAGNSLLSNRTDGRTLFNITIALTGPTGLLTAPQDGGPSDLNSLANDVTVKTVAGLTTLEVSLAGGVGGVKDSSVDATKVRLLKGGILQTLGVDYLFSYDPATDKIRLTSIGQLFVPGQYSIILDNSLDKGIFDNSGNAIQPNRNNGSVVYNATLLLTGPIGVVSAPADNGSADTDPQLNHVQVVSTTGLSQIDVLLKQDLAAINAATVTANTVKLYRDGVLLVRGTDYNFAYTAGISTISLTLTNATKVPASYRVVLDNTAATGIRDLSGARLQPNESDGSTDFFVSVVPPGPVASLLNPKDGSAIDRDPTLNNVLFYSQTAVSEFQVLLSKVGFAIDDATVDATKLTLTLDGVPLQLGTDYTFSYLAATDTITITAAGGEFLPGQYDIKLNNSATGILDIQGNQLRPNRASGTTELIIAFTPPGPISIPQGVFIANLGLSDIAGTTYVGFNLQGDPLSKLTVTVDAKVDPSGASTQLINTTLFVSANGLLTFSKLLPVDLNGESITVTVTDEFGQVITASSLIGPRATIRRAYVSSLFDNLLGRDGVLNETTDQFTPIESLVTYPAMAQALLTSTEFSGKATAALVKNIMGRTATAQEIATYGTQFQTTGSFNQARISLLTSDEFAKLPSDAALNYNDANHRALVTSYVQRVYAVLLPGVTLTPALLNTQVQNVFEGGRRWIITNNQDGGILASAIYHQTLVNQVYQQYLGRNATPAEQSVGATLSDRDVIKAAITTTDYIYTQLAQSIYREYLQLGKGQVDPAKVQALVQALKAGETENEARADVLATTDFRTNAGGTLTAFVENAYRQVLLRAPSATDITNGVSFVNANGGDVVAGRRAYALLLLSDPSYQSNSQGTLVSSGIQSAAPGSPVINGISQVQVTEGQTVQFVVSSSTGIAGPVSYNLAVAPDGAKIDSQTGKFTWTTPDSFNGIVPVTVEAVSKSNSQLRSMRTFLVEVSNIAPTAMIYASSSVIGGTEQSITLTADDPSSVDADANFTFDIDWNGDGITDQTVDGPSGVVVKHVFNSPGAQTINVTATDKDGGVSDVASATVFVGGIFVQPDPNDPTKNNLIVVGTDGADVITLNQDSSSGPVTVTLSMLNGLAVNIIQQFANITGHLEVFTAGGDDIVHAEGVKFTALKIDSGAGNDSLAGGYKDDTILAGDGNDTIWGLIGNDSIDGGAGDDLIFGDQPDGYGYSSTRSNLGNDTIFGGTGNDTIYGDSDGGEGKSDYIDAGDGDDMVVADGPEGSSTANDTIYGGDGNDLIFADNPTTPPDAGGKDSVDGGSGADIIYGGGGADSLSGGSGSDLVIAGYVNNLGISTFQNVQREWVSADSFLDRRAYISAQKIFGGANGSNYLVPGGSTTLNGNVLDDNAVDSIFAGNDTDGDWLLATAALDDLHDIHLNEDIVDSLVKV